MAVVRYRDTGMHFVPPDEHAFASISDVQPFLTQQLG